jgi:hypothetical protein
MSLDYPSISHHKPTDSTQLFDGSMKNFNAPMKIVNSEQLTSGCFL